MSGGRLFGTDGIRGRFGEPPLDGTTVRQLGEQLAGSLADASGRAPRVVLGGDTRASTPTLAAWLAAGFRAGGGELRSAGVLPTPGIAFLAADPGFDGGIVLSASHNPAPDNGIKLFDADGFKWDARSETALEARLDGEADTADGSEASPPAVDPRLADRYLGHLLASLPKGRPLAGLSLVIDAAHGAASRFAPPLFERLGASVAAIGVDPDGTNINQDRGSTRPEHLSERVRSSGAHLGIAFDGDADRALLVDETGSLQDGDTMLYLWATDLAERGRLEPAAIVATTMSNLGLELALTERGIRIVRCDVGDRTVVEAMRRHGLVLGGEQSGHLIHLGLATTGDGLLTALQLAHLVVRAGRPLSELAAPLVRLPQILVNVPVQRKPPFDELPRVVRLEAEIERRLGDQGRLLLRYSGTEPLARVMIEGRDRSEIERLAHDLADEIGRCLGASS